jgi:hypothetical protein
MPKQKMMLKSKIGLDALILTFSLREKGPPRALGEFSLRKKGPPRALGEFSLRKKGPPRALEEFSLRKKGPPFSSSPSGRRIKDEGKGVGLGEAV